MPDWIMQYWMQAGFGIIIAGFTGVCKITKKKFERVHTEQACIKMGVQALLRDRLIHAYNKYMEQGFIPIYAMDNVNMMYDEYHNLGGNGTVTGLIEELKALPKTEKEK